MEEKKRRKRRVKERTLTCIDCGATFTAFSEKALRCQSCKREDNNKRERERQRERKCVKSTGWTKTSKAERGAPSAVAMCPFWGEYTTGHSIVCEDGTTTHFESRKEKTAFMMERCGKNPEWEKCPIAKKILERYK